MVPSYSIKLMDEGLFLLSAIVILWSYYTRPVHVVIFSVGQSSQDSLCLRLGSGALRNPYLSSHSSSLYCDRSPHLKYRTTTVLKTFCVGRKSSLESPTWAPELFTLQDLHIGRLCQWAGLEASGST